MFFSFFSFANSAIFGFDYGESSIKVSTASEKHLIHWAMNSLSKRFNPQFFSLWKTKTPKKETLFLNESCVNCYDWEFGDSAKSRCLKYPKQCIFGSPLFKNDVYGSKDVETFASVAIRSVYDSVYKTEDLNEHVQTVFAIPSSFGAKERVLLLKALSIAGIDVTQLIPQNVATAEVYATERTSLFSGKEKNVAFLDIGAKGMRVSIFKFSTPNKVITVRELSFASDEEIGGNLIDKLIFDEMVKTENISFGRERDRVSLMEEVRKVKELLTLHEERVIVYDNGDETQQKQYKISREKLEELCKGMIEKLESMISNVLAEANVSVDSVELVGGSTRLPFISKVVTKAFNVTKVSHSVDADSSACVGAGYFAAQRSYEFSIRRMDQVFLMKDEFIVKIGDKEYTVFGKDSTQESIAVIKENIASNDVIEVRGSDGYPIYNFTVNDLQGKEEVELSFVYGYLMLPMPLTALARGVNHQITEYVEDVQRERFSFLMTESQLRRENEKARNDFEEELFKVKKFIAQLPNTSNAIKAYEESVEWYENVSGNTTTQEFIHALERLQSQTIHEIEEFENKEKREIELEKLYEKIANINVTLQNAIDDNTFNQTMSAALQKKMEEITNWLSTIDEGTPTELIIAKREELKSLWRTIKSEARGIKVSKKKKQKSKTPKIYAI